MNAKDSRRLKITCGRYVFGVQATRAVAHRYVGSEMDFVPNDLSPTWLFEK